MKVIVSELLLVVAGLSTLGALLHAFATFATSDYRPVIARGIAFSLLALGCFAVAAWWGQRATWCDVCLIVLPSLVALAELIRRAAAVALQL